MRQHVGFGSKTALLMAIGIGCNEAAGSPLTEEELVVLSGRGGTSGVGVNTTFVGGFVVDGGRSKKKGTQFRPSSVEAPRGCPPVLVRLRIPSEWRVHLFFAAWPNL